VEDRSFDPGASCAVYILTNVQRTVLYVGVTSNLDRRLNEHRFVHDPESFAARYRCDRLVYFETTHDIRAAIAREKQLKGWRRAKKVALVESLNPEWRDLSEGAES
jgi:putative endonuclease